MKKLIEFKKVLIISVSIFIFQACAVYSPYSQQQMPVSDIVQMSKDGSSSRDIIGEIRHTRSVYNFKADQLARLSDEGVSDSVINYMEKTHFDAISRNQWASDPYYGWNDGYGYGMYGGFGWPYWPYYGLGFGWGWGWGFGPTIIFRSNGFHHHYPISHYGGYGGGHINGGGHISSGFSGRSGGGRR